MSKYKLKTDEVYVETAKKDISIIHIADIHFSRSTKVKKLANLCEFIKGNNPDYIMITGDLIDTPGIAKTEKISELYEFLNKLASITKVMISIGNHDASWSEDLKFFDKLNELNNIYVLNDKEYHDEFIEVVGVTLPNNYYYNVTKDESADIMSAYLKEVHHDFDKLNKNLPKILMIHSPIRLTSDIILPKINKFDLILSGHTHAGMVPHCLNFLFKGNRGIIAPNKKIFPKVAKGKIIKELNNHKTTIIINGAVTKLSRQAGIVFNMFNFLWPVDINKIIITKKEGNKNE